MCEQELKCKRKCECGYGKGKKFAYFKEFARWASSSDIALDYPPTRATPGVSYECTCDCGCEEPGGNKNV